MATSQAARHRAREESGELTHVGKYQGDVVAANILGEPREAHCGVRQAIGVHVVLGLEVARHAAGKMRPGGTLLLMGGFVDTPLRRTAVRRVTPGMAFMEGLRRALCA